MSDAALNQDTGNPAGGAGGDEQHWTTSLAEDITYEGKDESGQTVTKALRDSSTLRKYGSPEEAYKGLINAQRMIGQKQVGLVAPGEHATDEERSAFQAELRKLSGVPDSADGYGLKVEGVGDEELGSLLEFAHGHGMNPAQVEGLIKYAQDAQAAEAKAVEQRQADDMAALEQEWGDKFSANMERLGLVPGVIDQSGELGKFLESSGGMKNPLVLKALHTISEMMGESKWVEGTKRTAPGGLTREKLESMMLDKRYKEGPDHDPDFARQVTEGFEQLYAED